MRNGDSVTTLLFNPIISFQNIEILTILDHQGEHYMALFHRLTGLECPACKAPIPFSTTSDLLGDENTSVPIGTAKCNDCDTEVKAKGNRWDRFIRLAAVYVLPAFVVLHLFGIGFALALNVILLPFALRVVGIERL